MPGLKITAVGDGVVGKTCLLVTYVNKEFPHRYVPTVFEQYKEKFTMEGVEHEISLWDTAGQEDYERLRTLTYIDTKCFILCFSVDRNISSYDNIQTKWVPEIRNICPGVPIILVATKIDLRDDPCIRCYNKTDGQKLANKIRAASYKECSALRNEGLTEIIREAVKHSRMPTKGCCTLF